MATVTMGKQKLDIPAGRLAVNLSVHAVRHDGTHFHTSNNIYNLSQKQYHDLETLLVNNTLPELMKLGAQHVAKDDQAATGTTPAASAGDSAATA